MDRGLAAILTATAGGIVALQPLVNSLLGRQIGTLQAALVSFVIGTVALAVVVAFASGGFGAIGDVAGVPWYYLLGGLMGVLYVSTALVAVRSLGAGGVVAATITGQLTLSVIADRFGWLGAERRPITVSTLLGVALLAAGTWLIVRD
ncbi:MAG: DMT family transporter [Solirubrobacteraceae bacterium]|nr:DMT family transporter [Solirubrobacteraceae bacterium]